MKTFSTKVLLLPLLLASANLLLVSRVTAQTLTILHGFSAHSTSSPYTNSDGGNPSAGLTLAGKTLYGTTASGGTAGYGTVFKVNLDGTGFTNLHNFSATSTAAPYTNSDGAYPGAGLILSSNTLYGTTGRGGRFGNGTVFKLNTNGTGFTTLRSFTATSSDAPYTNSDGANPGASLILSGNTLYGPAQNGGRSGVGTIFAVKTDGTGFTNLYNFTGGSDGALPLSSLILSSNILYGTAYGGGSANGGTVFKVNTSDKSFTTLHSFGTASNGVSPSASLILSSSILYGTTASGGDSGNGTVFKVKTDGTGFATLYSFTATSVISSTNSDGATPFAGLISSGASLYGTAVGGGSSGRGTVFTVNTDGTGFTTLYNFAGGDGAYPRGGLVLSTNILYGTTSSGGSSGNGTVFRLSLTSVSPPQLRIVRSGQNVILTWATNTAGFNLKSVTNLVSSAVWAAVSPGPVVANGQNTVTNAISGTQKFYRLLQ
jgi:uncharacterized repeat protein (TIGR03803 family)